MAGLFRWHLRGVEDEEFLPILIADPEFLLIRCQAGAVRPVCNGLTTPGIGCHHAMEHLAFSEIEHVKADVLAEAQQLGYAEADPTMDVDGTDAAQKLVLLSQLAFGTKVPVSAFQRTGIDKLELPDLRNATEFGYRVKLLATARLVKGQLEMHVQPTLVQSDQPLAKTSGAFNMVELTGDAVGRLWYSGAGAGEMPTASAVVADLIDMAVGRAQLTFSRLDIWREHSPLPLLPATEVRRRFYLRFNVEDRPHVLADIADILGRHNISIASVIQKEAESAAIPGGPVTVPLVIMTHESTEGAMRDADAELERLKSIRPPRVRIPVAS